MKKNITLCILGFSTLCAINASAEREMTEQERKDALEICKMLNAAGTFMDCTPFEALPTVEQLDLLIDTSTIYTSSRIAPRVWGGAETCPADSSQVEAIAAKTDQLAESTQTIRKRDKIKQKAKSAWSKIKGVCGH